MPSEEAWLRSLIILISDLVSIKWSYMVVLKQLRNGISRQVFCINKTFTGAVRYDLRVEKSLQGQHDWTLNIYITCHNGEWLVEAQRYIGLLGQIQGISLRRGVLNFQMNCWDANIYELVFGATP